MLTNFFGKSKPINFILLSLYLLLGNLFYFFTKINSLDGWFVFQNQFLLFLAEVFTLLLLNFIVKKNSLTLNNTYSVYFFTCFLLLIPMVFIQTDMVISNIFLLFSFRRLISLSSEKNREKKILDASIWISLSSLFYFWNLLYFIVLLIAIVQQRSKNYKLILIPFIGFLSVLITSTAYQILQSNSLWWFLEIPLEINLDFSRYQTPYLTAVITILTFVTLISLLIKLVRFSEIRIKEKSKSTLIIAITLVSIVTIVLIPNKNGAELIYLMAPLAILTANFLDSLETNWIKELFLWLLLISPIMVSFL